MSAIIRLLLKMIFGNTSRNQISSPPKSKWENISIEYKHGQEAIEALATYVNDKSNIRNMIQDYDVYFCPYRGRASFSNRDDNKTALKARNLYAKRLIEKGLLVERFSDSYVKDGIRHPTYILDFQHPNWLQIRKESGLEAKQKARQAEREQRDKRDLEAYYKRLAKKNGNVNGK